MYTVVVQTIFIISVLFLSFPKTGFCVNTSFLFRHLHPPEVIPLAEEEKINLVKIKANKPLTLQVLSLEKDYCQITDSIKPYTEFCLKGCFFLPKEEALKVNPSILDSPYNSNLIYHIEYKLKINPKIFSRAEYVLKKYKVMHIDILYKEIQSLIRAGIIKWSNKLQKYVLGEKVEKQKNITPEGVPIDEEINEIVAETKNRLQVLHKVVLGAITIEFNGIRFDGPMFIYDVKNKMVEVYNLDNRKPFPLKIVNKEEYIYEGIYESVLKIRIIGKNCFKIYLTHIDPDYKIGDLFVDYDRSYFMLVPQEKTDRIPKGGMLLPPQEEVIFLNEESLF